MNRPKNGSSRQDDESRGSRRARHTKAPQPRVIIRREGLELRLRTRRVRIEPAKKRVQYIEKLDEMIERIEAVINSKETDEKTRIKAVNTLTRVVKAAYTMVKDIEMEDLEREIKEIEERLKESEEEPYIGYNMENENGKILVWDKKKNEWVPEKDPKNKNHKIQPPCQV